MSDAMEILRQAVGASSAAAVARAIEYSPAAVSQVLAGKYPNPDNIMAKVREVYGNDKVVCPVLGEISLARCARERKTPFSAASPLRGKIYLACRTCGHAEGMNR
ncbi:MAG: hypothetical protein ABIJ95_11950 [Pseudomonadota bacterium]